MLAERTFGVGAVHLLGLSLSVTALCCDVRFQYSKISQCEKVIHTHYREYERKAKLYADTRKAESNLARWGFGNPRL